MRLQRNYRKTRQVQVEFRILTHFAKLLLGHQFTSQSNAQYECNDLKGWVYPGQ